MAADGSDFRYCDVIKMASERYDCHYCKESLLGKKYVLREENPYCVRCYETLYTHACESCKQPIGCDSKDLSYKDRHWHEGCFKCASCERSLADKAFSARDEKLLCTECHANHYSAKCAACNKPVLPGTRKMEFRGSSWHETCFGCARCQQPIGSKSFVPREKDQYCVPCYEKQFAQHCTLCKKAITAGGVTYRDGPWHRECLVCTSCKRALAGQRFTSRDDFPYCLECFSGLYAKRCVACASPISGLGGAKYISFEERQWHDDCFTCKRCAVSLVGRGFLTERDDILCPDCGRDL
ncbi:four and a half LIM domains protein 2-like isoform X1 [Lampetra planeri]